MLGSHSRPQKGRHFSADAPKPGAKKHGARHASGTLKSHENHENIVTRSEGASTVKNSAPARSRKPAVKRSFHWPAFTGFQKVRIPEGFRKLARTQLFAVLTLAVLGGAVTLTALAAKNNVYISDGQAVTAFATLENDTDRLLEHAGVTLGADDELVRTDVNAGHISIEIMRAFNVRVVADGKTTNLTMTGGDVGDALKLAGVQTGEDVKVNNDLSSDVMENMEIVVQRTMTRMVENTEVIPYKTVKKNSRTLLEGKTKVQQKGRNGEQVVVTEQTIVNGEVSESEVVSTTVTKKPVDEIVLVGTKQAAKKDTSSKSSSSSSDSSKKPNNSTSKKNTDKKTDEKKNTSSDSKKQEDKKNEDPKEEEPTGKTFTDKNGKKVSYKKLLTGTGTAYTGDTKTSTGRKPGVGVVAVNPKVIPYGSRLYIRSSDGKYEYGYAVAGDTGGALMSGRVLVDLYYNTESQCRRFGRRQVQVYMLK